MLRVPMDKIFAYCERGLNPAFWAEPLNALSNVAFLIAAVAGLMTWHRHGFDLSGERQHGRLELFLVALVGVIGLGSFLFHTFATRWAAAADVIPITIFIIVYFCYALRRFAGLGWAMTLLALVAMVVAMGLAHDMRCGGQRCFNGSIGYFPALGALALIGGGLWAIRHPAAGLILAGAAIFAVSLTFRSLDWALCPASALFGRGVWGTHFLWHMCNATLLYLLLRAAVLYGRAARRARVLT